MNRRAFFKLGPAALVLGAVLPTVPAAQAAPRPMSAVDQFRPRPSPYLAEALSHPERYGGRWPVMEAAMRHHTCACEWCDPSFQDQTRQLGDHHIALRFFDDGNREPTDAELMHRYSRPLSDGVWVSGAYEMLTGDPGTVWLFRGIPGWEREGAPAAVELSNAVNTGPRHTCSTCLMKAADARLVATQGSYHVLYRREWSALDERMITVRATPRWGACRARMTFPNVTAEPYEGARERWQAAWDRRFSRRDPYDVDW